MHANIIWYKHGIVTAYMPPYRPELHTLWHKLKLDGKNYKNEEMSEYYNSYHELIRKELWEKQTNQAIVMQNNHQWFIDNPRRQCPKCRQIVLVGGEKCLKKEEEIEYDPDIKDPTETAYYVGDRAHSAYQSMFEDLFTLCLAEYPRGDTIMYKDGMISLNNHRE